MTTPTKQIVTVPFDESGLKERNFELSSLLEMSNFLSATLERKELLDGALLRVLSTFELPAGRIYLKDKESEILHLEVFKGLDPGGLERIRFGEGFTGRSALTKSFLALHVSDLEDPQRVRTLTEKGFDTILCVPMILSGRVVGVMNLASYHEIPLDQRRIDLLISLNNQIAIAVDRADLYRELQQKIQRLEELNETVTLFAYAVSHDLKNPSLATHGLTRLLKKRCYDVLDQKSREYCDQILRATESIVTLLDELNAYVKAKEAPLRDEPFPLEDLLDELHNEFSQRLEKGNVLLNRSTCVGNIKGDKSQFLRMLRNLIDNALKYGGKGLTEISVTHEENEDTHVLYVHDNGIGMASKDIEHLFRPFHRLEASKDIEGTGLGLAIVKELTERHGGTVSVESEPGKGASFRISIPKRD
ncbi:MAG: GAF domain-containing sensor histidine kinase [Deltaproteobacteria bacterium]|nr:GAF domain-containing sensor histidine kinase [Deltaproteobacteria bacterium]